jgi:hypothetical protein
MLERMTERRRMRAAGQRCKAQQIDLFESDRPKEIIGAPTWLDLPAETQNALTSLMARLILEHADKNRTGSMTEASHDL